MQRGPILPNLGYLPLWKTAFPPTGKVKHNLSIPANASCCCSLSSHGRGAFREHPLGKTAARNPPVSLANLPSSIPFASKTWSHLSPIKKRRVPQVFWTLLTGEWQHRGDQLSPFVLEPGVILAGQGQPGWATLSFSWVWGLLGDLGEPWSC